jgi:hypothetical protein
MYLTIKQQKIFVFLSTNSLYCNDENYYKFGKRISGRDILERKNGGEVRGEWDEKIQLKKYNPPLIPP